MINQNKEYLASQKIVPYWSDRYKQIRDILIDQYANCFYKIKIGWSAIYMFWSNHTNNPRHPQFDAIKQRLMEFQSLPNLNKVVFMEWHVEPGVDEDMATDEVIEKRWERGYTIYLAMKHDLEYFSPEPSDKDEILHFLQSYSPDQIIYFYIIREYRNWSQNNKEKYGFDEVITQSTKWLSSYAEILQKPREYFSLNKFYEIHEALIGEKFENTDPNKLFKMGSPNQHVCFTNSMCADLHREQFIIQKMNDYINSNYDIFIVYWSWHALARYDIFHSTK